MTKAPDKSKADKVSNQLSGRTRINSASRIQSTAADSHDGTPAGYKQNLAPLETHFLADSPRQYFRIGI